MEGVGEEATARIGISIPDESTLRRLYLHDCYEVVGEICQDLEGHSLWLSVDDITDSASPCVGNVIVGKRNNDKFHTPYVVNCSLVAVSSDL